MKESTRILRFTIVGTLNALITALVIWLMMHVGHEDYMLANVVAYIVAQIHNFLWCKYWIFPLDSHIKKNSIWKQILFFICAFSIAYGAQFLFLLLEVEVFSINEYVAQFLGLFVYGAVNFISNKVVTFR